MKNLGYIVLILFLSSCFTQSNITSYQKKIANPREYAAWEKRQDKARLDQARAALRQSRQVESDRRKDERLNRKIEGILSRAKNNKYENNP